MLLNCSTASHKFHIHSKIALIYSLFWPTIKPDFMLKNKCPYCSGKFTLFFSKEKVIWAPEKKSGYFVELREPSGVINIHAQGIDNLY